MKSIRRWLVRWLGLGVLGVLALASYGNFITARQEANELFDYELRVVAFSLPAGVTDSSPVDTRSQGFEGISDDRIVIQIWDDDGHPISRALSGQVLPKQRPGIHTLEQDGREWRILAMQQASRFVQVAQPMDVRDEVAWHLALKTLWPLLTLLPIAILLVWLVVGLGLRPVRMVTDSLRIRSADALEPLRFETAIPTELQPLLDALNELLGRLAVALQSQRTFIADAAHELRSPLTALKLQLQLSGRNGALQDRGNILPKLEERLNRTIRLVNQLLTLAREDVDSSLPAGSTTDLHATAAEVVGDFSVLAEARHVDLGLEIFGADRNVPMWVAGERNSLTVLIANLVDNAVRYAPEGSKVDVRLLYEHGAPILEVRDDGPGIPEEELERIFDRFYRGEQAMGTGSGLGLAIGRRIAHRHGAHLHVSNRTGHCGLSVRLQGLRTSRPAEPHGGLPAAER